MQHVVSWKSLQLERMQPIFDEGWQLWKMQPIFVEVSLLVAAGGMMMVGQRKELALQRMVGWKKS